MPKKKIKTNVTKLQALIKDLHPMYVALLLERIQKIADLTREDIEKNPSAYDNPIVHHTAYLRLCDIIDECLEIKDKPAT